MGLIASSVKSLISKITIFSALAVLMSTTLAETAAIQLTVEAWSPGGDHAALLETPRAKLIKSTIDFIE